jgi:hypothetical protein
MISSKQINEVISNMSEAETTVDEHTFRMFNDDTNSKDINGIFKYKDGDWDVVNKKDTIKYLFYPIYNKRIMLMNIII